MATEYYQKNKVLYQNLSEDEKKQYTKILSRVI